MVPWKSSLQTILVDPICTHTGVRGTQLMEGIVPLDRSLSISHDLSRSLIISLSLALDPGIIWTNDG